MKIILLAITMILLFYRVKGTPRMLSKSLYKAKMQKSINKLKAQPISKEEQNGVILSAICLTAIMNIILILYYIIIGCRMGNNFLMILSSLQCATVFISFGMSVNEANLMFSYNIDDFKFHRFYYLLNVVLDYVYYPFTLYMLLK